MISKKLFIETMESIKRQSEKEEKFTKALEPMLDGHFVCQASFDLHEALIKVLEEDLHDVGEWIQYFIYEKHFGEKKEMKCYYSNGKEIKMDTINDLYNYLKKEYDTFKKDKAR